MRNSFEQNGLIVWTEREILRREQLVATFSLGMREALLSMNPAWAFHRIEAPQLLPLAKISSAYTGEDVWIQAGDEMVLRPETTPGSYEHAAHLLSSSEAKPPFVVWQAGKSFRREQDQPTKFMRLKEFYQQEFQCVFTADTHMDYHEAAVPLVREMIGSAVHGAVRDVPSDRLPSYSLKTQDIEVEHMGRWMEVCSISLRTDFPAKATFQTKKGAVVKDLLVLEVAIGLDRCMAADLGSSIDD